LFFKFANAYAGLIYRFHQPVIGENSERIRLMKIHLKGEFSRILQKNRNFRPCTTHFSEFTPNQRHHSNRSADEREKNRDYLYRSNYLKSACCFCW